MALVLAVPLLADGIAGQRFRIIDPGQVYTTLNRGDCLAWPNTTVQKQAGEDAWGGWRPAGGEIGLALGSARHCDAPATEVVILRLDDGHFLAIARDGIAPVKGGRGAASAPASRPVVEAPPPTPAVSAPAPAAPPAGRIGGRLSAAQRDSVLREHNRVRADVGVGPLEWSAELADYAQAWTDHLAATSCELHHRSEMGRQDGKSYGENLAAQGYSGGDAAWDPGKGVIMWEGEKPSYKGGPIGSDWYAAGHYTQVVWRNSRRVGCGVSSCTGRGWSWWILACNYDPPGNYSGQMPY